ncbi:MAG TPA: potassium-transporting ATPase subunit KdpC [Gemmataceae bacterium]
MIDADDPIAERQEASSLARLTATAFQQAWTTILSVPLLTLVTGIGFPLLLAAFARPLFQHQSEGSLVSQRGRTIGSALIGQPFSRPGYFHPRPSAAGSGYDALSSGGTNLGPTNPKLREGMPGDPDAGIEPYLGVRQLVEEYRRQNDLPSHIAVPIDAVTRSGSGLDPHISPANALLQVRRIARVRGLNDDRVRQLIVEHTQDRQFGFLGELRVSVLELNLALDRIAPVSAVSPDR